MAFTASVDICNLALHKIGHTSITAAQLADPKNNKAALACSVLYEPERDAMMEMHPPWRFLLRKVVFDIDDFKDTITGATAANPVVVTGTDISVANIIVGLGVHISGTSEAGLDDLVFYAHTVVDAAQTVMLYKKDRVTTVNGSAHAAVSAGSIRIAPLYDYTYAYKLPTSFIRIWEIGGANGIYKREGDYLLTDDSTVSLTYVFSDTTVSNYPSIFNMCLATKLAAELSIAVAESKEKKLDLLKELELIHLPRAHMLNTFETSSKDDKEVGDDLKRKQAGIKKE